MDHRNKIHELQINRMKKIFNNSSITLNIDSPSVNHKQCGNKLKLQLIYGISFELKFDVIYATAECEYCKLFSGYENDLVSAIESINNKLEKV